jgi:hypothetical protein
MKVIIIKSTNPFSWYEKLVKKIDDTPEGIASRTFDVEVGIDEENKFFRTKEDVAGPGVKGFINIEDTI